MSGFKKAERKQVKLKLAITGPSGGGKTYSSLLIAKGLVPGGRIALIDTENESASLYAGSPGIPDFDADTLAPPFLTDRYIQKIKDAEKEGYDVLIIDSLSHQWNGEGGILDRIDREKQANPKAGFTIWSKYTPEHERFKQAILQTPIHIICTMRSKTAYVVTENDRGKSAPRRAGMESIQRDGMDYEFTVVFDMEPERHFVTVSKDRTGLFDGQNFQPTEETGIKISEWLKTGKMEWRLGQKQLADLKKICESVKWTGVMMREESKRLFGGRNETQLEEKEFGQLCQTIASKGLQTMTGEIDAKVGAVIDSIQPTVVNPEFEKAVAETPDPRYVK